MPGKRYPLYTRLTPLLLVALAAAASAAPAPKPASDRSGNRLEALIEQPGAAQDADADVSPRYCSADRQWCVRTRREGEPAAAQLEVEHQVAGEAEARLRVVPLSALAQSGSERPWPFIVRMAPGIGAPQRPTDPDQAALENVLVGVVREQSTDYSGGEGRVSQLALARLYHQDDGIQIDDEVLLLPADSHAAIRACFSEADARRRADVCEDTYDFTAELSLDPVGQGMPVLRYRTHATRHPVGVSRGADSLARPPLRPRDLRTETVPACSYQRVLRMEGGRYQPDAALPDCADFTAP